MSPPGLYLSHPLLRIGEDKDFYCCRCSCSHYGPFGELRPLYRWEKEKRNTHTDGIGSHSWPLAPPCQIYDRAIAHLLLKDFYPEKDGFPFNSKAVFLSCGLVKPISNFRTQCMFLWLNRSSFNELCTLVGSLFFLLCHHYHPPSPSLSLSVCLLRLP